MTPALWTRKEFAFIVAILALLCAAAFLSFGLVYPEPIPSASLGVEWQCTKIAGILTTCSRTHRTEPVLQSSQKNPVCPRKA
jgi:hypothetical protein